MTSPAEIAVIVLAGGRSTRMGRDKATLELDGRALLLRTLDTVAAVGDERVVVRAPGQALPALDSAPPARVVDDAVAGDGPLRGIAAGLRAVTAPVAVVVGVDMPFLHAPLLAWLAARVDATHRWVLPVAGEHPQPLCSAIARDALDVIESHLAAGDRAPMAVAGDLNAELVPPEAWRAVDPDGWSFVDVDTPAAFANAERRLRAALRADANDATGRARPDGRERG